MVEAGLPDGTAQLPDPPATTASADSSTRTRGFLFADLRGYTSYVDAHGDHAAALLLDRYRSLVRVAVSSFRGAEIKTEGDSFYVVFDSASAAVRCGLAIVGAAASSAGGTADAIQVGVGVHAGETVETTEGYVGSAVNIAARLCAQAKAGELVVSETVRALTRTYLDVEFEPLGTRRLKGLDEPIALERVVPRGSHRAHGTHSRRAGGRGRLLVGVGLIALLAVAAGGAYALQGARPAPTIAPSTAPSTAPSAALSAAASTPPSVEPSAGAGAGLTVGERALLARIPRDFQPYCRRSSQPDGSLPGATASLRCDLQPGATGYGADTVWYDQFAASGLIGAAVNGVRDRQQLAEGDCATNRTNVIGPWSMGITYTGLRACYTKDGAAWILWTYNEGPWIGVRAVRNDGSTADLFGWWKDVASPFLLGT